MPGEGMVMPDSLGVGAAGIDRIAAQGKAFPIRDGEHGTDVPLGVEAMSWVMLALVMAVARGSVGGAGTSR